MSVLGWSAPGFEEVVQRVGERTGLCFAPRLRPKVEERIRAKMAECSIRELGDYLNALDSDAATFGALISALTIGETYFFRERAQFDYLRTHVVPELARGRGAGEAIRAWSAGCAAGEEAYSLAILFRELGLADSTRIVGTDLSPERVALARRGAYSRWSLRGVPDEVERRYFRLHGDRLQLVPAIRDAVRFHLLNLAEDVYPSAASGIWNMDLVLCRNVLIYLDSATVARVAERLLSSLSEDGWLFLGASDPALADLAPCEVVITGSGIAYRRARRRAARASAVAPRPAAPAPSEREESVSPGAPPPVQRPARPHPVASDSLADAALAASRYAARDYAGAAEQAALCVERDGSDPGAWVLLVRALANRGELGESRRACLRALRRHPTSAELLYLHALVLGAAERHADAATAARRALCIDRGLAVAHLLLGDATRRLGSHADAKRALRNAERLLAALPADEVVPASDGERAGRLLELARLGLRLAGEAG